VRPDKIIQSRHYTIRSLSFGGWGMQRRAADELALSNPPSAVCQFLKANLTEAGLRLIIAELANFSPDQQLTFEPEDLGRQLGQVPVLTARQLLYPDAFEIQYKAIKARNRCVWVSVKRDIDLLISTNGTEYARLRRRLFFTPTNELGIVTMISASIGSRIGVPANVVMPAVTAALLIEITKPQL
jgi:hypothetical protein